jgi:hypothetical protein
MFKTTPKPPQLAAFFILARIHFSVSGGGVTMDHRVKPGADAVGSVWFILRVETPSRRSGRREKNLM